MIKPIMTSIFFLLILLLKGLWAKIAYPIVYAFRHKADEKGNVLQWFIWSHLDEQQPPWGPLWFNGGGTGFKWAYKWSAIRNPMYNVNYNYLSNHSPVTNVIALREGNYKFRLRNGDKGFQKVTYTTADGRDRFLVSYASKRVSGYFGWNVSTSGRFTVALKLGSKSS